jgi:hypothetical protein
MSTGSKQQRGAALLMLLMIAGLLGAFFAMRTFGGARQHVEQEKVTQAAMVQAQDALLGFAATNDRLPCPAAPATTGVESPAVVTGVCTNPFNGFLPAVTLGLPGADANGYLLDGWGGRIRYAVTTVGGTNTATTVNGLTLASVPDLHVCGSATGIGATCGPSPTLTSTAVAVIFSLGANGSTGVAGRIDEAANLDNNPVFVSHPKTDSTAANGEFDDLMIWLVPGTCPVGPPCPPALWQPAKSLFFVMTKAGKL